MGYAPHEFRGFGLPVARRVSLTNEALEVLVRAFTGETFSFEGKRYNFKDVRITPGYVQPGGPPLWIAAMGKPGAERAAHHRAHLLPQGLRADTLDHWSATLKAAGGDPQTRRVGIIRSCLVTDDRERDWPAVREGERRRMAVYNRFIREAGEGGEVGNITRGTQIPQTWVVGDVDHCVAELSAFIREYGVTDLVTWGVPPGMRPDQMAPSLERFVRDVATRLRAAA
jgi:alkanesulfonate monooxygenase SsuD/methylene tetrahydromethanopterin reductase-like flavin-dependent oxidoreductase (luciferase family)